MLLGRLRGEGAAQFLHNFGQRRDAEEARVTLPGGSTWRLSLEGAAAAAKEVAACIAETAGERGSR
jgi:hypothetical protein